VYILLVIITSVHIQIQQTSVSQMIVEYEYIHM